MNARGQNIQIIVDIIAAHKEREPGSTASARQKLSVLFSSGIRYSNLKLFQDEPYYVDEKEIEKIQLIASEKDSKLLLYVRYRNNDEELVAIEQPIETETLVKTFRQLGTTTESIHKRAGVKNIDWQKDTKEALYKINDEEHKNLGPTATYALLHGSIIRNLVGLVVQSQHPFETPLNIIDGGCGDGKLLGIIHKNITGLKQDLFNNLNCKLIGFDFNTDNIKKCKSGTSDECEFITGDITKFENIINDLSAKGQINNDASSKTILILSGILTRLVMKDLYQGLEALTSIARSGKIDYLIGGGQGEPMINSYLAKQFGYKPREDNSSNPNPGNLFFYARMTPDEFIAHKLEKLTKKNILDLSFFCLNTDIIDKLSSRVKNDTIIDLSYCYYTTELENAILAIVKDHPQVRIIFQHNNEDFILRFADKFIGTALVTKLSHDNLKLDHSTGKSELSLFGSIRRQPRLQAFTRVNAPPIVMVDSQDTAKAPAISDCLIAYSGDRLINKLDVHEKIMSSFICRTFSNNDFLDSKERKLNNIFDQLKQKLLEHHHDLLQLVFGPPYMRCFADLKLDLSQGLTVNISGVENANEAKRLIALILTEFTVAIDMLRSQVLDNENSESILPLMALLHHGVDVIDSDEGYCLGEITPDLKKEIEFLRDLSEKFPGKFEPDFLNDFSRHLAANKGRPSIERENLTNPTGTVNENHLKICSEVWAKKVSLSHK